MHGKPKYIVSKANSDASAWRLVGDSSPIHNIHMPPDVAEEVKKYAFTSVREEDIPTLPEKEDNISDYRRSFFKAIEAKDEDSEALEKEWLKNFENEIIFDFLDKAIYAANFHDQVSLAVVEQLTEYCLFGSLNDVDRRSEAALTYERECAIPEVELTPDEFITTARNASLRALFTALLLSEPDEGSLNKTIIDYMTDKGDKRTSDDPDMQDELTACNQSLFRACIKSLIKLYAKHPIFTVDVSSLKLVFQAVEPELRNHFYIALNDWASYYGERHFYNSARNCYLLKEYLADMEGVKVEEVIALKSSKTLSVTIADTTTGIYIEE